MKPATSSPGPLAGRWRPTVVRLVDAVCPDDEMPEGGREWVLAEVDGVLAALSPPARAAILASAAALELSSVRRRFGYRRFSALDDNDARAVVDWLRATKPNVWRAVRLLRDVVVVCFYEHPEVRAAVGYLPDPFIDAQRDERARTHAAAIEAHARLLLAPDPLLPRSPGVTERAGRFVSARDESPDGIDCDVVIVGSGAGGAVVAAELAEAGLSVVVLEEGGLHRTEEFTTDTTSALRSLYRESGASIAIGRTPVAYSEGRCVGGSTVVNGAMAFRASNRVLDRWATDANLLHLRTDGLDDEYSRVERFLSVSPQDAVSIGRDQQLLRDGAGKLGWRVVDNTRAQVHCIGCNVCTWGCPTGAKQSTLVSYLPRAVHFGATVWSDCRVDTVTFIGKRAVGVRGRLLEGLTSRGFEVRAKRVVVACGAIHTAALLLRSGVRPPSGQLGRNLTLHPGAQVTAIFPEAVDGWKGAHQTHQVREFEGEGIVMAAVNLPPSLVARSLPMHGRALSEVMRDYNRMVTAGVLVEDTGTGRVRATGREGVLVSYRLNDRDASEVVRATTLLAEALFEAGATEIHLPFEGAPPATSVDELRRLVAIPIAPGQLTVSTVHLMGTARIGADPLWAVCDGWGRVYDTADLCVADASLFPGPVGVNPMLTIQALATRVAAGVIDRWPGR